MKTRITVTDSKRNDIDLVVEKIAADEAIIKIGGQGKPYRLYAIRQIDHDGLICRAEAPGNDPTVLIDVDGKHVVIKITGTTFGFGDTHQVLAIGPNNRAKLVDFLVVSAFPKYDPESGGEL